MSNCSCSERFTRGLLSNGPMSQCAICGKVHFGMRSEYDTKEEDAYRALPRPSPEAAADLRARVEKMIIDRRAKESGFIRRLIRWLWAPLLSLMCSVQCIEVPDSILHGIAAVEVGADWHPGSQITCPRGPDGEASIFQLSPAVLSDLHASPSYVSTHPLVAERLTRVWLSRLYVQTGSWPRALAAYHAGLRHWRKGREYAARVLNLAAI